MTSPSVVTFFPGIDYKKTERIIHWNGSIIDSMGLEVLWATEGVKINQYL